MELQSIQALRGQLEYIKVDPKQEPQLRKEIENNGLEEVMISNRDGLHLLVAPQLSIDTSLTKVGTQVDLGDLKGTVSLYDNSNRLSKDLFGSKSAVACAVIGGVVMAGAAVFLYSIGHSVATMKEPGKLAISLVALAGGSLGVLSGASAATQHQKDLKVPAELERLRRFQVPVESKPEAPDTAAKGAHEAAGSAVVSSSLSESRTRLSVSKPQDSSTEAVALGVAATGALVKTVQQIASPRSQAPEVRNPSVIEQIIDPRLAPSPTYEGPSVLAQIIDPKAPKAPEKPAGPSVLQQIVSPRSYPVKQAPAGPSLINEILSPRSNPQPKPSGKSAGSAIGSLFGAR